MPVDIPVVETPRLRLRGHRPDDFAACAAMWADPEVTRFTGGRPFTPEESWARLLRFTGHWDWFGHGFWAVEERATGAFVGQLGFADFKRGLTPSLDGIPEAGWSFAGAAQRQGFATEAMTAALTWADARLDAAKTACIIDPGNTASIRVALRCGYVESARTSYKGSPTLMFERASSTIAPSTSASAATN